MRGRTNVYLALKDLNLDKWALYNTRKNTVEVFVNEHQVEVVTKYLYENVSACYSDYKVIGVEDIDELIKNKNDAGAW